MARRASDRWLDVPRRRRTQIDRFQIQNPAYMLGRISISHFGGLFFYLSTAKLTKNIKNIEPSGGQNNDVPRKNHKKSGFAL